MMKSRWYCIALHFGSKAQDLPYASVIKAWQQSEWSRRCLGGGGATAAVAGAAEKAGQLSVGIPSCVLSDSAHKSRPDNDLAILILIDRRAI